MSYKRRARLVENLIRREHERQNAVNDAAWRAGIREARERIEATWESPAWPPAYRDEPSAFERLKEWWKR